MRKIFAADLFAGAGGTSTGLILAAQQLTCQIDLTAVNHWEKAIKTHEANYPWAKHLQADVEAVNPLEAVPGGRLDILVASPECIHHSRAAGGRPKNEQKRSHAWTLFRWLEFLQVDSVLVENVPEFTMWGPLNTKGQPIKSRRGEIFRAWLRLFRAHGYCVQWKVLNAADFGACTSRSRLFVIATRGRSPRLMSAVWPVASHSRQGWPGKRWHAAREIIDWSVKGESIFGRKRPLSPRTIQRIIEGLKRFGGKDLQPFIILMEHQGGVRDIEDPLPTITTARGGSFGLACPESFIVSYHGGKDAEKRVLSIEQPLGTLDTSNRFAVAEPYIVRMEQTNCCGPKVKSVNEPLPTITAQGRIGVSEPFLLPLEGYYRENKARSVDDPLGTITSNGGGNLVEPFLVEYYGNGGAESVEDPLHTVTSKDRFGLAEPYVLQFNGSQESQIKNSARRIDEPLPSIATQEHFGLVQPQFNGRVLDIKFRMLQPKELAAATGFPADYKFLGTKTEIVKQIGNAVVVDMAKALCLSLLQPLKENQQK
jgi:DNA (cytosine-5)-methyltransferase 1